VLVEHAISLRAVNALNEELLARQEPRRLGTAERTANEARTFEAKILRTGFAMFDTPLN
jgi:hypothetical protein